MSKTIILVGFSIRDRRGKFLGPEKKWLDEEYVIPTNGFEEADIGIGIILQAFPASRAYYILKETNES